jgi:hypothetical protein
MGSKDMDEADLAVVVGILGAVLIFMLIGFVYLLRLRGWCCFSRTSPGVAAIDSEQLIDANETCIIQAQTRESRLITQSARRREQERAEAAATVTGPGLQPIAMAMMFRSDTPVDHRLPAPDMGELTRGQAVQMVQWRQRVQDASSSELLEPPVADDPWYTQCQTPRTPNPEVASETISVASSTEFYRTGPHGSPVVSDLSDAAAPILLPCKRLVLEAAVKVDQT